MKQQVILILFCLFVFSACEVIDFHPYDGKLSTDERHINDMNIPQIETETQGKDTIRFVFFGNPNFSFVAGDVKFLCLNTNALEYDYSTPIPDFEFILWS